MADRRVRWYIPREYPSYLRRRRLPSSSRGRAAPALMVVSGCMKCCGTTTGRPLTTALWNALQRFTPAGNGRGRAQDLLRRSGFGGAQITATSGGFSLNRSEQTPRVTRRMTPWTGLSNDRPRRPRRSLARSTGARSSISLHRRRAPPTAVQNTSRSWSRARCPVLHRRVLPR
jgi:hypothetical protein